MFTFLLILAFVITFILVLWLFNEKRLGRGRGAVGAEDFACITIKFHLIPPIKLCNTIFLWFLSPVLIGDDWSPSAPISSPPTPHAINNDWSAKQPPPWTIQTFGGRSACCQVRPHLSDHIVFVRSLAEAPDAVISCDNVNIISYKSGSVTCHLGALTDQLVEWRGN